MKKMKSLLINVKKKIIIINWNAIVKIIIVYAALLVYAKLKKKDRDNIHIVMLVLQMILKMKKEINYKKIYIIQKNYMNKYINL